MSRRPPSMLDRIVERKRVEIAERRRRTPLAALRAAPRPPRRDFRAALHRPGLSIIAEIKRRSPSKGALREGLDPAALAHEYERGGAAAVSVLTDEAYFGGADDDLVRARAAVGLPVLRKDFTLDEYQVHEAAALGADAILLLAAVLDDAEIEGLSAVAGGLGLAVLLEVHDEHELERGLKSGARLIGVNNRDLRTFEVALETALRLRPRIPPGTTCVAESGVESEDDVRRLADAGYDALLIGEALVRSPNPAETIARFLSAAAADGKQT